MSIEELMSMAVENHWQIEWTTEGELVFFTGVIDESKAGDGEDEDEDWDDDDGEEGIDDPLTT
jgi:hypothetical protein